jgi:uncharacterized protein YkwD
VANRTSRTLAGIATTIIVALMSVPTLSGRGPAAGDVSAPNVVKQTNDVRMKNGIARLTLDPLLTRAAQAKAEDMAARGYFAHKTPDGRMPWDWIESVGYQFLAAAENLAVGYPTDADLISAWMESEGHRHNLLNQRYTDIGIGVARGKYKGQDTIFVVQMFGKPRTVLAGATLEAAAIPVGLQFLADVTLEANGFDLEPTAFPAVPLDSSGVDIDPILLGFLPLDADDVTFDVSARPGVPLESSGILVDHAPLPGVALEAAAIPFGTSRLPAGIPALAGSAN